LAVTLLRMPGRSRRFLFPRIPFLPDVIPAQAGIHLAFARPEHMDSRLRGNDA